MFLSTPHTKITLYLHESSLPYKDNILKATFKKNERKARLIKCYSKVKVFVFPLKYDKKANIILID